MLVSRLTCLNSFILQSSSLAIGDAATDDAESKNDSGNVTNDNYHRYLDPEHTSDEHSADSDQVDDESNGTASKYGNDSDESSDSYVEYDMNCLPENHSLKNTLKKTNEIKENDQMVQYPQEGDNLLKINKKADSYDTRPPSSITLNSCAFTSPNSSSVIVHQIPVASMLNQQLIFQ